MELGANYGDLPVHDGLWASACDTKDSLEARLAIVHLVHEARGLDVYLQGMAKLTKAQDWASVEILKQNHVEEIGHVATALKWFQYLGGEVQTFHTHVRQRFEGQLKPPFNTPSRELAGMTEEWYVPLASRSQNNAKS